jgi:serine/threonine-protein kinase RsbW
VNVALFREEFPSTFEAMAATLDRAVNVLRARDLIAPEEVACTRLCLEEALVNAIRHGNGCDARRKVSLEVLGNGEYCTIRVRDEGTGFAPEQVTLPECDQLGGRGICLMRHYMDKVQYNERERCLEMKFHRKAFCKGD